MPINELEEHPFLNYYEDLPGTPSYYRGLIIGSFPIYAVTNTIDRIGATIQQRLEPEASMRFFYGSRKSQFWNYTGQALTGTDPRKENGEYLPPDIAVQRCKQLLFNHRLLISDSLYRTNREATGSEDKNLMVPSENSWVNGNKSLNHQIPSLLRKNKGISSIYFTSTMVDPKSPYGWFAEIFEQELRNTGQYRVGNRLWSRTAEINLGPKEKRILKLFFLPTPKTRGISWKTRRLPMFEAYIRTYHQDFFLEINDLLAINHTLLQKGRLSGLREQFLIDCYSQALVHSNETFTGDNLLI